MTDIEILSCKIDDLCAAVERTLETESLSEERRAELQAHADAYDNIRYEIAIINSSKKTPVVDLGEGF